jgi:Sulfotransferase domain
MSRDPGLELTRDVPSRFIPYSPNARYIAMVRDPKDTIVSGYHFVRSLVPGPLMPSVKSWVELHMSGSPPHGFWAEHVASYWRVRDEPNVLFLTYEQLSMDPCAVMQRIARFMKVDLSPQQLGAVTRSSSLGEIASARGQFGSGGGASGGEVDWMSHEGVTGRSGEWLEARFRQRIDEHFRAELRRLGCDFPYDAMFSPIQWP